MNLWEYHVIVLARKESKKLKDLPLVNSLCKTTMSFRFNPAEKPRFFVIDLDQNRRVFHLVREVSPEVLLSEYYDDQGGPTVQFTEA